MLILGDSEISHLSHLSYENKLDLPQSLVCQQARYFFFFFFSIFKILFFLESCKHWTTVSQISKNTDSYPLRV